MAKYSELDSVKEQIPKIAKAVEELVHALGPGRAEKLDDIGLESPIEAIFMLWWDFIYPLLMPRLELTLHHQFGFAPINERNYRADFVIWPTDLKDAGQFRPIIIELDGHDFHERTKEQVASRNQRDRDFQEKGYHVLHFSGSELHRDPYEVVSMAIRAGMQEFGRFIKAKRESRQQVDRAEAAAHNKDAAPVEDYVTQ